MHQPTDEKKQTFPRAQRPSERSSSALFHHFHSAACKSCQQDYERKITALTAQRTEPTSQSVTSSEHGTAMVDSSKLRLFKGGLASWVVTHQLAPQVDTSRVSHRDQSEGLVHAEDAGQRIITARAFENVLCRNAEQQGWKWVRGGGRSVGIESAVRVSRTECSPRPRIPCCQPCPCARRSPPASSPAAAWAART